MKCSNCGKCCNHSAFPNLFCNHLIRFSNGKTKCSVYDTRLNRIVFPEIHIHTDEGMLVYPEVRCGLRKDNNRIIKGCSQIQTEPENIPEQTELNPKK